MMALHVVSDAVIVLAYFTILVALFRFVRSRGDDLPSRGLFVLFGAFILLYGFLHGMPVWTAWQPDHWLAGWAKAATAVVSLATAAVLVPTLPKAMALTSPHDLERLQAQLVEKDEILRAGTFAAARFLRTADWKETAPAVLQRLGEATGVNRAYIFSRAYRSDGSGGLVSQAQWCSEGVGPRDEESGLLTLLHHGSGGGPWVSSMLSGEGISGAVDTLPQEERAILEAEGVRSIAVAPIMVDGKWWGVLGFDDCDRGRGWNHEMSALLTAADVLGAAIERHARATRIAQQDRELRETRKLEAVGRLAGGVAHDINNLLSVVLGNVALALEHGVDEDAAALLVPVMAEVGRSRRLIEQLLTFARRQDLQREVLDLSSVVRDMGELLATLVGESVELFIEADGSDTWVDGDRSQIEQVVSNLALNARDAMSGGGRLDVIVTAEPAPSGGWPWAPVDLPDGAWVRLEIGDTGEGIPSELIESIFDPFFTTKAMGLGTGLGLSTVHGVVAQAGGYIVVESKAGVGSTFHVLFPAAEPDAVTTSPPVSPERVAVLRPRPTQKKILLVEDNVAVRTVVERILVRAGHTVRATENPDAAMATWKENDWVADLILTDMVMPGTDVNTFIRRVREHWPGVEVIGMSGHHDPSGARAGLADPREAVDRFLPKPFEPDELVAVVDGRGGATDAEAAE